MEAQEVVHMFKGRRTKRQRSESPLALTMATTSSSSTAAEAIGGTGDSVGSTKEEEDMANCLILLAKGQTRNSSEAVVATDTTSTAGLYAYECKTCYRRFPSFQALGGHRASHKKPNANTQEKRPSALVLEEEHAGRLETDYNTTTDISLQISSRGLCSERNKSKVHKCSICGAEFTSGQALGGHMRRHRPMPVAASRSDGHIHTQEAKKPRNPLYLDLNLPAAEEKEEEDHRESKFSFALKEQVIVFTASHSLVDCHY